MRDCQLESGSLPGKCSCLDRNPSTKKIRKNKEKDKENMHRSRKSTAIIILKTQNSLVNIEILKDKIHKNGEKNLNPPIGKFQNWF